MVKKQEHLAATSEPGAFDKLLPVTQAIALRRAFPYFCTGFWFL